MSKLNTLSLKEFLGLKSGQTYWLARINQRSEYSVVSRTCTGKRIFRKNNIGLIKELNVIFAMPRKEKKHADLYMMTSPQFSELYPPFGYKPFRTRRAAEHAVEMHKAGILRSGILMDHVSRVRRRMEGPPNTNHFVQLYAIPLNPPNSFFSPEDEARIRAQMSGELPLVDLRNVPRTTLTTEAIAELQKRLIGEGYIRRYKDSSVLSDYKYGTETHEFPSNQEIAEAGIDPVSLNQSAFMATLIDEKPSPGDQSKENDQ